MISKSQLLELTSHAGPKACTHLRDKIEALFQNDEVVSTQDQQRLFSQLVETALERAPVELRKLLAVTIAEFKYAAHDVIVRLASDEATVAAPVLRHSPVLSSKDLLLIARWESDGHRSAIASRQAIEPQVTKVLLEQGGLDVARTVAENPATEFGAQALGILLDKAGTDPRVQIAIATRASKEPRFAKILWAAVSHTTSNNLFSFVALVSGSRYDEIIAAAKTALETARQSKAS